MTQRTRRRGASSFSARKGSPRRAEQSKGAQDRQRRSAAVLPLPSRTVMTVKYKGQLTEARGPTPRLVCLHAVPRAFHAWRPSSGCLTAYRRQPGPGSGTRREWTGTRASRRRMATPRAPRVADTRWETPAGVRSLRAGDDGDRTRLCLRGRPQALISRRSCWCVG